MNQAIIAGGTGLVGKAVIHRLQNDAYFDQVVVLNRRQIGYESDKIQERIVDFDHIDSFIKELKPTHAFCCLGTTIKVAGSKENFRKVDYQYVLNFAQAVKRLGCENFSVITALGTNSSSLIFYNQVKYELSIALENLYFDRLNILQPSLLLGDRSESRLGEDISKKIFEATTFLWKGPLKNYKGIQAKQVAKAMVTIAKETEKGVFRFPSGKLQDY